MAIVIFAPAPPPLTYKPTIEFRSRFERRLDKDFDAAVADDRADLFTRVRVGLDFIYGPQVTARLQYQLAQSMFWRIAGNGSTDDNGFYQAFAEYKEAGTTLTVGRQKISNGSERLIGAVEWQNVGRAFDAVRVRSGSWDFWGGQVGVQANRPANARLGVLSHKHKFGDTSFIYKWDQVAGGTVNIGTLDYTYKQTVKGCEFGAEVALQGGRNTGKDQSAWAAHLLAAKVRKTSRVFAEVNAASGGSGVDANHTFDNLYPTNHNKYGILDMQGWRNMLQFAVGVDFKVNPRIDAKVAWRYNNLMDAKDGWYGAAGVINKRSGGGNFLDPTGASGKHIGSELDFEAQYKLDAMVAFQAGFAFFSPGTFVKNVNGGAADTQYWGFVSFGKRW